MTSFSDNGDSGLENALATASRASNIPVDGGYPLAL